MAGAPTGINPAAATGLSQPTGLEALLAHPYFQAAAAGLFGMLASPRQRGLSGALGLGGLGALNAFQQAEKQKLTLPLLAAQIQGQQAQTQQNLATGGLRRTQTAALQGQLQGDAESADHMHTLINDPNTPAAARRIYAVLEPSVRSGKIPADKVFQAAQKQDLNAAQQLLAQTRTALAGEQLKLAPGLAATREQADIARAGEAGASAALSQAKMGEVAPTIEHLKAETERVREGPATKPKAVSALDIDKQAEAEAQNEAKSYWWASGEKRNAFVKQRKAEAVARLTATAGSAGAGAPLPTAATGGGSTSHAAAQAALPKGWKMTVNPDGSLSATDLTGKTHHWED